jgi:hypothetical protein
VARGKGIEVPITADTKGFIKGTKQAEDTLEDFGDSLDAVAKDGTTAAERLDRAFADVDFKIAALEAEQAATKIEGSFKDAARAVGVSTDKIKADSKSSFKTVGAEAGQEFSQNFGEAIRSGNPAEAIVETVTSLSGALGGVGLALAGAFGIGAAIVSEIEKQNTRVREAATGLFNAARQGAIDAAAKEDFVNTILGTESWADALRKLAPLARTAGVSIGEVVQEIETGGTAVTGLDTALKAARDRADALGASPGPQQVAAALGPAGKAAQELAGFFQEGAAAIADQNALLQAQRDIALNSIRLVEQAGRTARGVTNAERTEINRTRP